MNNNLRTSQRLTFIGIMLALIVATSALVIVWRAGPRSVNTAQPERGTLSQLRSGHSLRAGYIEYPPLVAVDPATHKVSGYVVDFVDEIAKEAGFKVEYVPTTWETMGAGLQTGQFDVVITAVFETIPRAKDFAFTRPIMFWGTSVLGRADEKEIHAFQDLNQPRVRIAVSRGTAEESYAQSHFPNAQVQSIAGDLSRPGLEVISARADVAISNTVTAGKLAHDQPGLSVLFGGQPLTISPAGFMIRQGDPDWLLFLNSSIETLTASGQADEFRKKYGNQAQWLSPPAPWK